MNRYAFYFLVGMLAFGVGSVAVSTSYFKEAEKPQISENINQKLHQELSKTGDFPNETDSSIAETKIKSFGNVKFICEDELLTHFFVEFVKDKRLFYLNLDKNKIFNCSEELNIKEVDLNNDELLELIVSFRDYSAHGNCPQIIFEQKNKEYTRLLQGAYGMSFKLLKQKTKKYRNLQMFFNSSYSGRIENYKFNGKEYKIKSCFDYYPDGTLERIKCSNFNK